MRTKNFKKMGSICITDKRKGIVTHDFWDSFPRTKKK